MRIAIILLLFVAPVVQAQSVSPVIAEFGGKASGQFTVTDNGLTPLSIFLQPQSFTAVSGQPRFGPLDTGVHLKLSEGSARVGAKQTHTFYYTATCDKLPCWFSIYSVLGGAHAQQVALSIRLPHTVYICEKQKGCRAAILTSLGIKP